VTYEINDPRCATSWLLSQIIPSGTRFTAFTSIQHSLTNNLSVTTFSIVPTWITMGGASKQRAKREREKVLAAPAAAEYRTDSSMTTTTTSTLATTVDGTAPRSVDRHRDTPDPFFARSVDLAAGTRDPLIRHEGEASLIVSTRQSAPVVAITHRHDTANPVQGSTQAAEVSRPVSDASNVPTELTNLELVERLVITALRSLKPGGISVARVRDTAWFYQTVEAFDALDNFKKIKEHFFRCSMIGIVHG